MTPLSPLPSSQLRATHTTMYAAQCKCYNSLYTTTTSTNVPPTVAEMGGGWPMVELSLNLLPSSLDALDLVLHILADVFKAIGTNCSSLSSLLLEGKKQAA